MLTFKDIKRAIIDSLSPDLLTPQYRAGLSPEDPPETGHCAVASEAFYHIAGGKQAGFMPVVCGYSTCGDGVLIFDPAKRAACEAQNNLVRETRNNFVRETQNHLVRETHWWIRGAKNGLRGAGDIFDVTAAQYPFSFPYEKGRNTGFMQPQQKPSKRAQIVIDRVTEKLGVEKLAAYRQKNISAFQALQKKPRRSPAPHL